MSGAVVNIVLALAGAIVGLALALLVQPLLEDSARSLLVRRIGGLSIRRHSELGGDWHFVWWKDGETGSREYEEEAHLESLGTKLAGTFMWKGSRYQFIGSAHSDAFVSGTYVDEIQGNTFHGAFQLRVLPGNNLMEGRWIGFNSKNEILSGPWYLRRAACSTYSYEANHADALDMLVTRLRAGTTNVDPLHVEAAVSQGRLHDVVRAATSKDAAPVKQRQVAVALADAGHPREAGLIAADISNLAEVRTVALSLLTRIASEPSSATEGWSVLDEIHDRLRGPQRRDVITKIRELGLQPSKRWRTDDGGACNAD